METIKTFLSRHWWARILAAALFVVLTPVWMVAGLVALLIGWPYTMITEWANDEDV